MAFIYKITNLFNQKCYIGKTESNIIKRFNEHISDSKRDRCKNRPLYRAFNKYGIDNFKVEVIEETDNPSEREIFWIEYFGSFKYGYNATIGGDGSTYVDRHEVIQSFIENNYDIVKTVKSIGHDRNTIKGIVESAGFTVNNCNRRGSEKPNAVLTEDIARAIKKLYVPKLFGKRKIAKLLDIPIHLVSGVITGKSWSYVIIDDKDC